MNPSRATTERKPELSWLEGCILNDNTPSGREVWAMGGPCQLPINQGPVSARMNQRCWWLEQSG